MGFGPAQGLSDAAAQTLANAALPKSGGTMTGALVMGDQELSRPRLKDVAEVRVAKGSISGAQSLDCEAANVFTATITGETTWTFSNPPATGYAGCITLILTNGGSATQNWPNSVDWPSATAPTLTAAGVDILTFMTLDGGTTWYGVTAALDTR